jgi:hypothetical protein
MNGAFALQADNGSLLRLFFSCRDGVLITTPDTGSGTYAAQYCQQVSFIEGQRISVIGTLITPSDGGQGFIGDLYVLEM